MDYSICNFKRGPIDLLDLVYIKRIYLLLITNNIIYYFCFNLIEVLVDAAVHPEHGPLIRCNIGPKTIERSENEYMSLRLIINTYNIFIGPQPNKSSC
jgi:hypothetical protein